MLSSITALQQVEIAAPIVVFAVVISRLYFGGVIFAPRYAAIWNTIRRVAAPLVQRLIYNTAVPNVKIENEAVRSEYVGTVDLTGQELALRVDGERDVEIPLLAGFKTDWDGHPESSTFVWYCGRTFSLLPNWLRPYQVHVFTFRIGDRTRVCAHLEANPWRPDMALDHLFKGDSFSPEKGVARTMRALQDAGVTITEQSLEV